jgi:hypothetical protein
VVISLAAGCFACGAVIARLANGKTKFPLLIGAMLVVLFFIFMNDFDFRYFEIEDYIFLTAAFLITIAGGWLFSKKRN